MKCQICGKDKCRKPICQKCYQTAKRHRLQAEPYVATCKICGKEVITNKARKRIIQKRGYQCNECSAAKSSVRLVAYKKSLTKERRSEEGRIGKAAVRDRSAAVRKQWETIRSDPKLRKKAYRRLRDITKDRWSLMTDEQRAKQIACWLKDKSRSKVCDELKREMLDAGIEGFTSEECFHGFVPDEINHDLRLIVELYGDLYHCNPRVYKDASQYVKKISRTVGEQWKRDRRRLACFYKHGYNVVVVWEKDFRNDPQRQIARIKDAIEKQRKAVSAA